MYMYLSITILYLRSIISEEKISNVQSASSVSVCPSLNKHWEILLPQVPQLLLAWVELFPHLNFLIQFIKLRCKHKKYQMHLRIITFLNVVSTFSSEIWVLLHFSNWVNFTTTWLPNVFLVRNRRGSWKSFRTLYHLALVRVPFAHFLRGIILGI